jgi:hypothetical protein
MTIAQDKYFVIDTNADGSTTLKTIIEFIDANGKEVAVGFSFHNTSRTAIVSELPGFPRSLQVMTEIVPNLAWQKFMQPTGVEPPEISWIYHNIYRNRIDLRHPYRGINPRQGTPDIDYRVLNMEWNGSKFEHPGIGYLAGGKIWDKERLQFFQTYFGTLEELTERFNWHKGVNRLDIEYKIEKVNNDGSTILKTIYFWEHPDYPAHCLVRIWARATDAIVIITSLHSNIPPEQDIDYDVYPTNYVGDFLPQVMLGIHNKYEYLLGKYKDVGICWVLETQIAHSYEDSLRHSESCLDLLKVQKDKTGEIKIEDVYIEDDDIPTQTLLRGEPFGSALDSLDELGWLDY